MDENWNWNGSGKRSGDGRGHKMDESIGGADLQEAVALLVPHTIGQTRGGDEGQEGANVVELEEALAVRMAETREAGC